MKRAMIFQSSKALGDRLFISWAPKELKRKHDFDRVYCATWKENACLWDNNPFVDGIEELEKHGDKNVAELLQEWEKDYKVFDFRWCVEGKYLKFNYQQNEDLETRRTAAQGKSWYAVYDQLGLVGGKPEIYLSDEERQFLKKFKDGKKRILWQPLGSGRNKALPFMPLWINHIANKYREVENWIAGNESNPITAFARLPNIIDARGKWSVRNAAIMTSIFDLIIGPESFFVNAAAAFDIPVICLMSHSAPENLLNFHRRAWPIKPKCDCHPCYLIHKDFRVVWNLEDRRRARAQEIECSYQDPKDHYRVLGYKCCVQIDHNELFDKIHKVLFLRDSLLIS